MATDAGEDFYATVRRCLEEWDRLKLPIRRSERTTVAAFESSIRALVVAYCRDDADPGSALEAVVTDERLRGMVVGPRGEMEPQSLLEEGLRLLGDERVARMIASRVMVILAENRGAGTAGAPSTNTGRGGGEPVESTRAKTAQSDETSQNRRRREAAENLKRLVLSLRDEKRDSKTQLYLDRRQRGASWLAKSYQVDDSKDIESRFIFSWIALDALFGAPQQCCERCLSTGDESKPRQGYTDLMWFLRMLRNHDSKRKMLTYLDLHSGTIDETIDDQFLVKDYWDVVPPESVKSRRGGDKSKADRGRKQRDPVPILEVFLAHRLKTLRNQLIHGAATDRYSKRRAYRHEEALFERQTDLLEGLVGVCLEIMEDVNGASAWPCIPDPRYESTWHRQKRDECPLMRKGASAPRHRGATNEDRVRAKRNRP